MCSGQETKVIPKSRYNVVSGGFDGQNYKKQTQDVISKTYPLKAEKEIRHVSSFCNNVTIFLVLMQRMQ